MSHVANITMAMFGIMLCAICPPLAIVLVVVLALSETVRRARTKAARPARRAPNPYAVQAAQQAQRIRAYQSL